MGAPLHTNQGDTMNNTTPKTAAHGYVIAYAMAGGTVGHIVPRYGTGWNDYKTTAICGTTPRRRYGFTHGWTSAGIDDTYPTPAEAAAGRHNVCRRCSAAVGKYPAPAAAEDAPAPEAEDAPAVPEAEVTAADNTGVSHPLQALAGGTYYPVSGDAMGCSDTARLRAAAAAAIRNTPALLTEAREWIHDAYPIGDGAADTLTPPAVCRVLERGYSGGCIEFYLNSLQLTPTLTRKA